MFASPARVRPGSPSVPEPAGRENGIAQYCLEQDYLQPVGARNHYWVQAGLEVSAKPIPQASNWITEPPTVKCHSRGDTKIVGERRHRRGTHSEAGVLLQVIPGAEKRPANATGDQPSAFEQLPSARTLQDGRNSYSEGPPTAGRLADTDRSKGRLLCHSHPHTGSEVLEILVAEQVIPVHLPPLRAFLSPESVHEGTETSNSLPQEQGGAVCDLHRRHTVYAPRQGQAIRDHGYSSYTVGSSWVSCELHKVSTNTDPEARVPGICGRHTEEGARPSSRETAQAGERCQSHTESPVSLSTAPGQADRQDVSHHTGGAPSSIELSEHTTPQACSTEKRRLRQADSIEPGIPERSGMVDREPIQVEWQASTRVEPHTDHRDRCFTDRLGCLLPGSDDGWLLEHDREGTPHQFTGNAGSILRNQGICPELSGHISPNTIRQPDSCGSHQQDGGHQISTDNCASEGTLGLVSPEEDLSEGTASARSGECHGRLPVKTLEGQNRLDTRPQCLQMPEQPVWSSPSRSIRDTVFQTAPSLLQLEAGSRSRSHGCLHTGLVQYSGICPSSLVPYSSGTSQGTVRGSISGACHTTVAIPGLVSRSDGDVDGLSNRASSDGRSDHSVTKLRLSSGGNTSKIGRLEGLRKRFRSGGVSEQAIELILASWRSKTNANYDSAWKAWEAWSAGKGIHPFEADVCNVLDFLAEKFDQGLKYRTLNCYRSALSSALLPIEGFQAGSHPLVSKLLKGIFNLRPPEPRYTDVWDVGQVLRYLQSMGPNESLSLRLLTKKLATLLALVLAHRCSDLGRLSLEGRKYSLEGAVLKCTGLAKQARPGKQGSLRPVVVSPYPEDPLLCPVSCLKQYEKATSAFRGKNGQLFLGMVSPHRPVTTSTIARWLKQAIVASGISSEFTAHSTRGAASTAAAMNGVTIREVMARAGWSSQDTFSKHYYRPSKAAQVAAEFGTTVLSQSTNMHRTC